jgi:hypothetical protein
MSTIWNPWFVQKPTFPSKTITHYRLTKGERESFILKLQQFTGTQEIILLLLFGAQMERILEESKKPR